MQTVGAAPLPSGHHAQLQQLAENFQLFHGRGGLVPLATCGASSQPAPSGCPFHARAGATGSVAAAGAAPVTVAAPAQRVAAASGSPSSGAQLLHGGTCAHQRGPAAAAGCPMSGRGSNRAAAALPVASISFSGFGKRVSVCGCCGCCAQHLRCHLPSCVRAACASRQVLRSCRRHVYAWSELTSAFACSPALHCSPTLVTSCGSS
jgi:hypothetical protein